jgi:hypothetical protein
MAFFLYHQKNYLKETQRMKKILPILLTALCILMLFSCNGANDNNGGEKTQGKPERIAIENYTICYAEGSGEKTQAAIASLANSLSQVYGVQIAIESDFVLPGEQVPSGENEILIGKTNRAQSAALVSESDTVFDWHISYDGKSICAVGGSDEATAKAVLSLEALIKDDGLFSDIVCALVPDRHEKTTEKAIGDIGYLLSRYFTGVIIEVLGVALINFIGLWLIARLGLNAALGIAFLTGIFNVIPYVGPLLGGALGTTLSLILKYSSVTPVGLDVNFWVFTAILIAIFSFTQLVDNFLYQPVIYSTSIKSKPLEIFIVLLIVGNIGGPLAMIVAIPIYTVFRVIAFRFFGHIKAISRLIPSEKLITKEE